MGIDSESNISANLQIGPTTLGMVRIYVEAEGVELPLDFDPDEAEEIAEELRAAAARARRKAGARAEPARRPKRREPTQPRGRRVPALSRGLTGRVPHAAPPVTVDRRAGRSALGARATACAAVPHARPPASATDASCRPRRKAPDHRPGGPGRAPIWPARRLPTRPAAARHVARPSGPRSGSRRVACPRAARALPAPSPMHPAHGRRIAGWRQGCALCAASAGGGGGACSTLDFSVLGDRDGRRETAGRREQERERIA
jgi:hypothetical protein